MCINQTKLAAYDSEWMIYRYSNSIVVTSDGGFLTIWVLGDRSRCQFVHRLSQLGEFEQIELAKKLVHQFILNM